MTVSCYQYSVKNDTTITLLDSRSVRFLCQPCLSRGCVTIPMCVHNLCFNVSDCTVSNVQWIHRGSTEDYPHIIRRLDVSKFKRVISKIQITMTTMTVTTIKPQERGRKNLLGLTQVSALTIVAFMTIDPSTLPCETIWLHIYYRKQKKTRSRKKCHSKTSEA